MRNALVMLLLGAAAHAAPISITGQFLYGVFDADDISFSGPGLSVSVEGLTELFAFYCPNSDTTPCDLSHDFPVTGTSFDITYNGQLLVPSTEFCNADCGTIQDFLSEVSTPYLFGLQACPDNQFCSVTLPFTISGSILATYQTGQELYDLAVTGSGSMTANFFSPFASEVIVRNITSTFSGTASPIPEPDTGALFGSGCLALTVVRRRWKSRRVRGCTC